MIKVPNMTKGGLKINESREGETIEEKVNRIVNNKEPIKDGAPLVYTERKDGVSAGYNIRTDRWEVAVQAMDKVNKTNIAKRDNVAKMSIVKEGEEDNGVESIRGEVNK